MLIFDALGLSNVLVGLFLELDSLVYALLSFMFQVFIYIASARVFTVDTYKEIAERAYIVIGVVALFLVAFSLLQAIINPDNMKGKNSPVKVIQNVLISIVLLGVTPMLFNFAYELQSRVISSNILQTLILGGNTVTGQIVDCDASSPDNIMLMSETHPNLVSSTVDLEAVGASMSVGIFSSFFYGVGKSGTDYYGVEIEPKSFEIWDILNTPSALIGTVFDAIRNFIFGEGEDPHTLCETYEAVKATGNFTFFKDFVNNAAEIQDDNKVQYTYFVSTLFGGYAIYMLLSFCIGLAVRAFRLGFYQIIAPIPILSRIVPQGKKVFDNWVRSTLSTFAEVFIRLVIIFFAIFMVNLIVTKAPYEIFIAHLPFNLINPGSIFTNLAALTGTTIRVYLLARALLILGVLIFANKAIKIVTDLFGIKSGSLKLGIKDQIKEAMFIGKPLSKGMNKAQGFITGAAGAGFSALKGKISGQSSDDTSIGKVMLTGGISGAGKGGTQFSSQRDAEFKRRTGKDGPDTMWGNFDRWSKEQTAIANKNAREAHKSYIKQVESSDEFSTRKEETLREMLNNLMASPENVNALTAALNEALSQYLAQEKEKYINEQLNPMQEHVNQVLDTVKSDSNFQAIKNNQEKMAESRGMHLTPEELEKRALQQYNQLYNSSDSDKYKELEDAINFNTDETRKSLDENFDKNIAASKQEEFKSSSLYKATVNNFENQLIRDNELDSKVTKQVTDEFKEEDVLYKNAKSVIGDWETAERQKDFRAVVEKMMKDEKEKNGGGTPPPPKDDKK